MIQPARTLAEKVVIVSYLASKLGTTPQALIGRMPFEAAQVSRAGQPVGALLFTNFRQYSVELTAAGERGWLTRHDIQQAFTYAFQHLGVWTVFTMISRSNATSRELNRRLGFTELCVIETGEGKGSDIVLYGMTRDKCMWIPRQNAVDTKVKENEFLAA